jgi:hypothetical protein
LGVSALFNEQPHQLQRSGVLRRQILHLDAADDDVHLCPAFAAKDLLARPKRRCQRFRLLNTITGKIKN